MQLKHCVANGECVYLAIITPVETKKSDSMQDATSRAILEVGPLLQEFADVFPDSLPKGLPPERGVTHRIELVPDARPPVTSYYKMSPAELDEFRR